MRESIESDKESIPVDVDELTPPPRWATVDARKEDSKWDDLEETKRSNDKRWLVVYGWVLLAITLTFSFAFIAAFMTWVFHYIAPYHSHWLEEPQLNKIQSVLFSGGMGAIISSIIRTQIEKTK